MIFRVEDVFATEGVPKYTFISPPNFAHILIDIRSERKPLVFEGASGTGKTSAIIAGLSRAGITDYRLLSARVPSDLESIRNTIKTGRLPNRTTVIDDFHRLSETERKSISDLVRAGADNPDAIGGKIIIAGINKVGEQLINASEDLLKRIGIYRIPPASLDEAMKIMEAGCALLKVKITNLQELVDESRGDYWTVQKKCQVACLNASVFETQNSQIEFVANMAQIQSAILGQLSTLFDTVLKNFVRGSRFRKTNRPYLKLLELFADTGQSSISLNELAQKFPQQKPRLDLIKKTRLPKLLEAKGLTDKFYYDTETTIFSIEDPGLSYYIRKLDWKKFAADAGFPEEDHDWVYEMGISFAGEQRELAAAMANAFTADDITTFYDEYSDLVGKDLETELANTYGDQARYVVVILSDDYTKKTWPAFEAAVWGPRVKDGKVIPIFIDDVILKEVSTSICRIDFRAFNLYKEKRIGDAEYKEHLDVLLARCKNILEER